MMARVVLAAVALSCAAGLAVDDAYALKASGNSVPRYGSDTAGIVCGDRLCSELEEAKAEHAHLDKADFGSLFVAIESPFPGFVEPGEPVMTELEPGVYSFYSQGYNSLVVISGGEVLVTDPANDERAAMMKEAVEAITDAPVKYVAMSHEHYDHVGGADAFEGAQVVCHVNCQPVFDLDPIGMSPEVHRTFDEYLELDVGGISVELHFLGPGDGDATTVMYLPEEQVVFTADLYGPRSVINSLVLDDIHSTGAMRILETMAEWPLKHAITAHSDQTDPVAIREGAQFFRDLRDAVLEAIEDSDKEGFAAIVDTYENPGNVRLPEYADWKGYDEHMDKHVQRMIMSLFHGD